MEISGTNVTYTYNDETREFTANRIAVQDENGIITSNAYSYLENDIRYNTYDFSIIYPVEAYDELGDAVPSIELLIPLEAWNEGFNNYHEDSGFDNPFVSNKAIRNVVINWNKKIVSDSKFNISVGTYMGTPYNRYVISKKKPINVYNGNSVEEDNDTYSVKWTAIVKSDEKISSIIMEEGTENVDKFITDGNSIPMEEMTANKEISFTGASTVLGEEGWIKVYNAETNDLIKEFTSEDWNEPYPYNTLIKHIKVETSEVKETGNFIVNNIKELDDEYITETFSKKEFDKLTEIRSNLFGNMKRYGEGDASLDFSERTSCTALYREPISLASIAVEKNKISTQSTTENEKIIIKTETSDYNHQKWKKGTFLVKFPSEIIDVKINNIEINNMNSKILTYNTYIEDKTCYIRISTECDNEESYSVIVDCNLTSDPRINDITKNIELYAIDEYAYAYHSKYCKEDIYDVDGDLDTEEQVNYTTIPLSFYSDSTLITTQSVSNYDEKNSETVAPGVAIIDKNQQTAKISIFAMNNYNRSLKNIKILGLVPCKENGLGSEYTSYMKYENGRNSY